MSIFDVGKVMLFSEMKGQVWNDGKPMGNAKVRRTVDLFKEKEDFTMTDDKSFFHFDEWNARSGL